MGRKPDLAPVKGDTSFFSDTTMSLPKSMQDRIGPGHGGDRRRKMRDPDDIFPGIKAQCRLPRKHKELGDKCLGYEIKQSSL